MPPESHPYRTSQETIAQVTQDLVNEIHAWHDIVARVFPDCPSAVSLAENVLLRYEPQNVPTLFVQFHYAFEGRGPGKYSIDTTLSQGVLIEVARNLLGLWRKLEESHMQATQKLRSATSLAQAAQWLAKRELGEN